MDILPYERGRRQVHWYPVCIEDAVAALDAQIKASE